MKASLHRLLARQWVAAILVIFAASLSTNASAQSSKITIKDLKGRTVTLDRPARRLLIDDGRFLVALSLLHPDPVSVLAAWPRDIHRIGPKTYEQYLAKFPQIATIPQVGSSAETFSIEKALAAKPDVAVISLGVGLAAEQIKQLEAAGIKVVHIDFFSHPFENLEPSLRILGQLIGRGKQADDYIAFRKAQLNVVTSRLQKAKNLKRPKVFFEAHAGISEDCCNSPGQGNLGDYITLVGGHNIAVDVLKSTFGRISLEYVISSAPDVYIATGGPHLEKSGGLVLGQGYTPAQARGSLAKVAARPGIAALPAVRNGRTYGISHQLLNSPLDILAVQAMAKWMHPALFADINLEATLAVLNKRFLAIPYDGTYWISLR